MIEIEHPGPRATIQDLGRPGFAALGVGRSGATDRAALRLANRLVGNLEHAACLELTLGGLRARFHTPALVAVTGADCTITLGGSERRSTANEAGMNAPFPVEPGEVLHLAIPATRLRTYVAVRGGIDVPLVLGSRSTDTLSGIGPAMPVSGTELPIGRDTSGFPNVDVAAPHVLEEGTDRDGTSVLRISTGPRSDWFTPAAHYTLTSTPYTVTSEADRIGARLSGPRLEWLHTGDLKPEGMVTGALQVPPDGHPILFLADHPVTGGYPVIAVVRAADLDRAGQLRPGDQVRFRLG